MLRSLPFQLPAPLPVARPRSIRTLILALCTVGASLAGPLTGTARAQLDLPKTDGGGDGRTSLERRGGGLVVHLQCTRCQTHNYREAVLTKASEGKQKSWCSRCGWSTDHRRVDPKRVRVSGLDLPLRPRSAGSDVEPAPGEAGPRAAGSVPAPGGGVVDPVAGAPVGLSAMGGAAGFVLELLSRVTDLEDEVVEEATHSLLSLGEPGLEAARAALLSGHGPTVLVGARVCLRGGGAEGARAVLGPLAGALPPGVGPLLLEELARTDPVLVTPRFLVGLLDHPEARMRAAVHATLSRSVLESPGALTELASLLGASLASPRTDTRRRAVDLLEGLDDPLAMESLLACLGDRSASVSGAAVAALARAPQPDAAARLVSIAFDGRWLLRREAYALLALVEREDRLIEPLLRPRHVEPLLSASVSRDPFVSGAVALALAGIGFRTPEEVACPWMDREVPDRLVRALSGTVFHNDFSALQAPAARRLTMISGETFGTDGPAWVAWWLAEREGFRARRAALSVAPEEEALLSVRFRDTGGDPRLLTFIGPAVEDHAAAAGGRTVAPLGELFRLTAAQCRDLVALLRREGLLDVQRLPGLRGQTRAGMRVLEISFGADSKSFTFGPDRREPWFDAIAAALTDLEGRSRWQAFPPPVLRDDPRAFWTEESLWWDLPRTPAQRDARLRGLIVESLPGLPRSHRGPGGELLAELYGRPGAAQAADFSTFLYLIKDEPFLDGRARLWLSLARRAAGLEGDGLFERRFRPVAGLAPEAIALAGDLVDTLELQFGGEAAPEIAALMEACGPQRAVAAASDGRPILRAVAAALLARSDRPGDRSEDWDLLLDLLDDAVPGVEVAAVQAIGEARLEFGRTEVFLRARLGQGPVRMAALEAVGRLGGEAAVEVLLDGLRSAVQGTGAAAARGLVHLADPATAPVLVGMLGGTRQEAFLDPVRTALLGLGKSAHPDLIAALRFARPEEVPSNTVREAALLLARQGVSAAAAPLMRVLAAAPQDSHVARELAILTAVDFRGGDEPPARWKAWWGTVVHDDAHAWLRAGAERAGFAAPPAGSLGAVGERAREDAFFFLAELMERGPEHLAERARRLLEEQLGRAIEVPRPGDRFRQRWFERLRDEGFSRPGGDAR